MALVEAGIAGEPRLEASGIELDRPGPSYTVDTVASLIAAQRAAGLNADVTVVLSADASVDRGHGTRRRGCLALARIAVALDLAIRRPTSPSAERIVPGGSGRIDLLDLPPIDVSASAIRSLAALGEPLDGLVPPAVATLIRDDRLYRQPEQEGERPPVTDPMTDATAPAGTSTTPRADGLPTRGEAPSGASALTISERPPLDLARRIVELAEDKKAADIVLRT